MKEEGEVQCYEKVEAEAELGGKQNTVVENLPPAATCTVWMHGAVCSLPTHLRHYTEGTQL